MTKSGTALIGGSLLVSVFIGIVIGNYARGGGVDFSYKDKKMWNSITKSRFSYKDDTNKKILEMVTPANIRKYLEELAAKPHLAGTRENVATVELVLNYFKEFGLQNARTTKYKVLLSYPDKNKANQILVHDENGGIIYNTTDREDNLRPEDNFDKSFVNAFLAFTPKGNVTGKLVYAHYGRVEDFEVLKQNGVSVEGKIVLCRYGMIFRGNKVINAQGWNASAVIIYSDPREVANFGTNASQVYPNSLWMPDTAMQRGTAFIGNGDPETPGYPSIEGVHRVDYRAGGFIPTIPCQPIGYRDAKFLLEQLDGIEGPKKWQGKIANVTYRFGPSKNDVTLTSYNEYRQVDAYNVIATIPGEVEPDRYVILGNHRDAWGFGAVDPSSGTAGLLETARVLGQLYKEGSWKPRRTIVFASWDAEEYGLVASTEWVEAYFKLLTNRGVAYVNVDMCVRGDVLSVAASPGLADVTVDTLKLIPGAVNENISLYEETKKYTKVDKIKVPTLGSGSDHSPFAFMAGVPSVNLGWYIDYDKYKIFVHPAYHTAYETLHLVETFMDPDFRRHRACSRLMGLLTRHIADASIVPVNVVSTALKMKEGLENIKKINVSGTQPIADWLGGYNMTLDYVESGVDGFVNDSKNFRDNITSEFNLENPLDIRRLNDILIQMERIFLKGVPLPNRNTIYRHLVFAPSAYNSYSTKGIFPGFSDILTAIQVEPHNTEKFIGQLKEYLTDLVVAFKQAADHLKPASAAFA